MQQNHCKKIGHIGDKCW